MMPRELLDNAKEIASKSTGIPANRMLISATHTHSAPAAMGALGCRADTSYVATLPAKIAESIAAAHKNLRPARIGWASVDDADDTHNRRWIRRPDKPVVDPFGQPSARAQMHPGYQNPDVIGPSGPVDPELFVLALQTPDGKPLALLANYSMHYFGAGPVSSDYFGRFDQKIGPLIGVKDDPAFVAIMSQGTSGDQHWMDYGAPETKCTLDEYAIVRRPGGGFGACENHVSRPCLARDGRIDVETQTPRSRRLASFLVRHDRRRDGRPRPEIASRSLRERGDLPSRRARA